jgi:two-component system cell cycle response regulator CtrA
MSLLDVAGRDTAQIGIRSQVWDPDTRIVDKGPRRCRFCRRSRQTNVASAQPGSKRDEGGRAREWPNQPFRPPGRDRIDARPLAPPLRGRHAPRRGSAQAARRHPAGDDRLAAHVSPEDSEEAASKLLAVAQGDGGEMPETLCGGRLSVDQVQRLIRIDGHPIGITEMEYRVLELLAFARNNVVTRAMLLKHLYRRADDQPQPKIIDVFISKLRKKLRNASGGAEFIETIPQRGWILRDIDEKSGPRIHELLSAPGYARFMLQLILLPQHRPSSPRSCLMPRRCRGWRASAMRCGWSTASAAGPATTSKDDEQVAAAWPKPARRAALLRPPLGAAGRHGRDGHRSAAQPAQKNREPHEAASETLVDEIRRELRDVAGIVRLSRPQHLRRRRVGAPLAPASVVQLAASSLPIRCAAKIRLLAVTPEPQLATNGRAGSMPASANSRRALDRA